MSDDRFVVVTRQHGEFVPVHPGHTDEAGAKSLKKALGNQGIPSCIWTHDRWNRYDDQIRAEVFCETCGEERPRCKCPERDGEYSINAEDAPGY